MPTGLCLSLAYHSRGTRGAVQQMLADEPMTWLEGLLLLLLLLLFNSW